MFEKGVIRDKGIDITIKNNPEHILAPNDWTKVLAVKLGKMSQEEYTTWYKNLIRERWNTRKDEFEELAKKGFDENIKLKCFCPVKESCCHAYIAAKFMNGLVEKLKKQGVTTPEAS